MGKSLIFHRHFFFLVSIINEFCEEREYSSLFFIMAKLFENINFFSLISQQVIMNLGMKYCMVLLVRKTNSPALETNMATNMDSGQFKQLRAINYQLS